MSNIPNLASLARLRLWSWGWSTVRRKAFWFDWVNDYISSNATIGRTGYDMNVSGNVTTGSDGDGSYIQFNGNRAAWAATWTTAWIAVASSPWYTQANSFTLWWKFKVGWYAITTTSWLFWPVSVATISYTTTNTLRFTLRWSTTVNYNVTIWFTLWTAFYAHMVYDSATAKFYCYIDWILKNTWWTTWPATFNMSTIYLWDTAIGTWNADSSNKYIYHAAIRNKALTQAEIDADIALWNTTKSDPTIVAYYIPENLQYDTDYITTKDFSNASWTKTGTTITAGQTDPNWWTSAYELAISAWASNGATITDNTVTWSSLASKTFIMKVFAKTASWTATMRLRISHNGVATYYWSNQTVTTDYQEFTFTQALTSSTSGTWMTYWIEVGSGAWAATFVAYYPTDWLTNQTLRDNSPNIWWYIGRKTQKILSCRVKPNSDTTNTSTAWGLIYSPRCYLHDRGTSHTMIIRYDDRIWAKQSSYTVWWAWFRNKVHVLWLVYWTWSARWTKLYINWVLQDSDTHIKDPSINVFNTSMRLWRNSSTYFATNIRDARIYTFTWSFTDADALAIYNWWEPTSAWVTKYLHYRPPVGEVWTTTQDQSPNDRDWTLNGGVTRDYI